MFYILKKTNALVSICHMLNSSSGVEQDERFFQNSIVVLMFNNNPRISFADFLGLQVASKKIKKRGLKNYLETSTYRCHLIINSKM